MPKKADFTEVYFYTIAKTAPLKIITRNARKKKKKQQKKKTNTKKNKPK